MTMVPSSPTRTAPSSIGGAVTGYTRPARTRSITLRADGTEPRMDGAKLCRFGAGVEPVPVAVVGGAERRREVAGLPIDFACDQRIGPHPFRRRRPAVIDVAHERGPGRRHDAAAAPVVHDALLQIVADPDPRHDLRREPDIPGVGVVVGRPGLAARGDREAASGDRTGGCAATPRAGPWLAARD